MACKPEFVEYVCAQLSGAGQIRRRKMFGDYGLYCDGVFFALACDDQLFIKITSDVKALHPELSTAPPYDGAKDHFLIDDLDARERLTQITTLTCMALAKSNKRRKN